MSLVRVNRYSPRGAGRKALKVKKKKSSVKQEWDVSRGGILGSGTVLRGMVLVAPNSVLDGAQYVMGWDGVPGMLHPMS